MTPAAVRVVNVLLPGVGLVLRGRLVPGLPFMVIAMAQAVMVLVELVAPSSDMAGTFVIRGALAYLAFGGLAAATLWQWEQGAKLDPVAVRELHRQLATAYLRGDLPTARSQADKLVVAAGREPGAWALLALVAGAAGDKPTEARAKKRAATLEADLKH